MVSEMVGKVTCDGDRVWWFQGPRSPDDWFFYRFVTVERGSERKPRLHPDDVVHDCEDDPDAVIVSRPLGDNDVVSVEGQEVPVTIRQLREALIAMRALTGGR